MQYRMDYLQFGFIPSPFNPQLSVSIQYGWERGEGKGRGRGKVGGQCTAKVNPEGALTDERLRRPCSRINRIRPLAINSSTDRVLPLCISSTRTAVLQQKCSPFAAIASGKKTPSHQKTFCGKLCSRHAPLGSHVKEKLCSPPHAASPHPYPPGGSTDPSSPGSPCC